MRKITRRAALLGTLAAAACARTTVYSQAAEQGLQDLAAAKGVDFGSMVTWKRAGPTDQDNAIQPDDAFARLIERECGIITSAMEIFWGHNSDSPGEMRLADADALIGWAQQHGKKVRGHNLIWHGQMPKWYKAIGDKAYAEKMMVEHVTMMCSRFAGRIHSWDVVNEPLNPNRSDGLRDSLFYKLLGPAYLDLAFSAARQADPKALLTLNEFDLEYDFDYNETNRRTLIALIDGMKQRGTPIDAIGIQSHLSLKHRAHFSQEVMAGFLKELNDRGIKVMVTELDVVDKTAPGDIPARDAEVASMYKEYLDVILASPATKAIVTWGIVDTDSWISHYYSDQFRRDDGLPPRPLLFDGDLKPKPAYFAVAGAFRAAPAR